MDKKLILMLFRPFLLLLICILGLMIWVNIDYRLKLKEEISKQIKTGQYGNLPKLIQALPSTEQLLTTKDYKNFWGNDKVRGVNKTNNGKLIIDVEFTKKEDEEHTATISYNFNNPIDMSKLILLTVAHATNNIVGTGYQRSRTQIEITDTNGKLSRGPKVPFSDQGEAILALRPTIDGPIPMGSARNGFNPSRIRQITIRFILARYPDGISKLPVYGKIYIDLIYAVRDLELVTRLFGDPDVRRVTKDNINISYEIRRLTWQRENKEFFVGLNYPWNNYGWDIGKNPYGLPENSGWSANEKKLSDDFLYFKSIGISVVRIYLFFDLRTGLEYNGDKLIGFDKYTRKDIETIFRVAGQSKIKVIPVLFDFGIADTRGKELGGGEHPELIFSSQKENFLINVVRPLLTDMNRWNNQYGKPVFAVEVMNEPENMLALVVPGYFPALKVWFQDLINIIHNETTFKVTLGSHSIVDMQRWWNDLKIDVWQYHFYKNMLEEHEQWPQNLKRDQIKNQGLIFAGEMQPYNITQNIEALKNNGYDGILFWAWNTNDGYGMKSMSEMNELVEWIQKNTKEAQ